MSGRRPNLFIVGAPRCGTSSMHHYLAAHPDVFMSPEKEPHFFSNDLTAEGDRHRGRPEFGVFRNLEQYLWLFRDAGTQPVVGEASVLYLYSKVAAANIQAFDPAAKIICMIREPVSFLHSLHSVYLFHLDEDRRSFAEALALEPARRRGEELPRTARVPSLLYYSEMARFSAQIERYRALFPDNQIKVIVQDDLAADPAAVYADVLAFAGLEPRAFEPKFERVNASKAPRSRWLADVLASRHPLLYEAYRHGDFPPGPRIPVRRLPLVPLRLQGRVVRLLDRLNTKQAPRPALEQSLRARLRAEWRPEVERLSALLDRDLLRLWGYDRAGMPSR